MNNKFQILQLNIEIENTLYRLISLLKENNKPKEQILTEIEKFKKENEDLLKELDSNYIEDYLNKIYAKRNKGQILIEDDKSKEER